MSKGGLRGKKYQINNYISSLTPNFYEFLFLKNRKILLKEPSNSVKSVLIINFPA
jgi:hypothetical protein